MVMHTDCFWICVLGTSLIGIAQAQSLPPAGTGSLSATETRRVITGDEAVERARAALKEPFIHDFRSIKQHLSGIDFVVNLGKDLPADRLSAHELRAARAWLQYYRGDLRRAHDAAQQLIEEDDVELVPATNARLLSTLLYWRLQILPQASFHGTRMPGYVPAPGSGLPSTPFGCRSFADVLSDFGAGAYLAEGALPTADGGRVESFRDERQGIQPWASVWFAEGAKSVEVRSRVKGMVKAVHFEPGEKVIAADLLYEITSDDYRAALRQALAAREVKSIEYEKAVESYLAAVKLLSQGNVDVDDIEHGHAQVEVARASLDAAEAAVRLAQRNLDETQVCAPISGCMKDVVAGVGEFVGDGPLATVAKIGRVEDRFVGALTVSDVNFGSGKGLDYWLVYRDLEGPPIMLLHLGETFPTTDKLHRFAAGFRAGPPVDPRRPGPLRVQMEAAWFHRVGIAPLAAAWCREMNSNSEVIERIKKSLIESFAWHWEPVATYQLERGSPPALEMTAYRNRETVPRVTWQATAWTDDPESYRWEHYHYAIAASGGKKYLASYRLVSERVNPSGRLYLLERVQGDEVSIVDVYGELPEQRDITATVRRLSTLDEQRKPQLEGGS